MAYILLYYLHYLNYQYDMLIFINIIYYFITSVRL